MEKNAATYAFNLSNWLLGLMIVKEILVVIFLFYYNDLTGGYGCGMGILSVFVYMIIFIIGIPFTIQIFKASKEAGSNSGGLVGSGVLFVIGLITGMMMVPFFTFFFVIGLYIFTYHVIKAGKRGTFGMSIFLFFVATCFTYMGFFIRNATGLWVTIPLGILTSILFIISHSMHIKLNNRAKKLWKPVGQRSRPAPRQQRAYGQKPQYSYHERPPTAPVKRTPPVVINEQEKDGGEYNKRILEAPSYLDTLEKKPVTIKAGDKPRLLDAPPGYD